MAGVLVQQLVEHHLERLECQSTVLHGLHPALGLDAPDKELQLVPRRRYPRHTALARMVLLPERRRVVSRRSSRFENAPLPCLFLLRLAG